MLPHTESLSADAENAPPPVLGKRQQGIEERRRRLIRAAGELILENDEGAFSMPDLARRAGLSLATPYNLFGSKAAVLSALFETQIRGFHRDESWMQGLSPLDRILGFIDRLIAAYSRQPRFFRNMRKALFGLGPSEQSLFPLPANGHLVERLLRNLAEDGLSLGPVEPDMIRQTLTHVFNGALEAWALQDWPVERLRGELTIGFCLVFHAFLSPAEQQRVPDIIASQSRG